MLTVLIDALLIATLIFLLRKYLTASTQKLTFFAVLFLISLGFFMIRYVIELPFSDEEVALDSSGTQTVKIIAPSKIKTRLSDIAGMNEAKKEITEIVDFLKDPKEFARLGAKPPKGVLIYGPPGTGKTLMARAIAGEANVSFLSASGSAFNEVYVGTGAARVRELFKLARKHKPCIVFIDEMDALAGSRQRAGESGNDQTVNQFLSELDNIESDINEGIIFLGATNRLESIDEAVLRPGRFDRKVFFRLPNLKERGEILALLLTKITHAKDIKPEVLAQITSGYSGADLANLVNEAAIDATRRKKASVDMASFEEANDKIILGVSLGSGSYTKKERELTAYHEAGHALVGLLHPAHPRVFHKMTIGLRGSTLGVTHFRAEAEEHSFTRIQVEALIAASLGGYAAEEIVFGRDNITTGASTDLVQANEMVRAMVTEYAMADERSLLVDDIISHGSDFVASNASLILNRDYADAVAILKKNRKELDLVVKALLEKETLDYEEVAKLIGVKAD